MPIYNCGEYLREALSSLIVQTYKDFEIIAINDGSTDDSLSILQEFSSNDTRIRIINQKNAGIVKALNSGVKLARGEYIARMDGDDASLPHRFADQVKILNDKKDIVLVSGSLEVMNSASEFVYRETVVPDNDFIQRGFYLRNVIAHGSVMFRKGSFNAAGGYREGFGPTEDLDLWMRLSKLGSFTATNTSVYRWRINYGGLTHQNNEESIRYAKLHISRRWNDSEPMYLSRSELLNKVNKYRIQYPDRGSHYKLLFLADTCQIAVKFIARGQTIMGVRQLLAVAFTGRVGLKCVTGRLGITSRVRLATLIRRS